MKTCPRETVLKRDNLQKRINWILLSYYPCYYYRKPKRRKTANLSFFMVDRTKDTYQNSVINKSNTKFCQPNDFSTHFQQWKLRHNCIVCATDCATGVSLHIILNLSSLHAKSVTITFKAAYKHNLVPLSLFYAMNFPNSKQKWKKYNLCVHKNISACPTSYLPTSNRCHLKTNTHMHTH